MDLAKFWRTLLPSHRRDRRSAAERRRKPRRFIGLEPLESRQMLSVSLSLDTPSLNENGGTAHVTATLTSPLAAPVTLELGLSGTAVNGTDYNIVPTGLTIPAGQLSATATITAINTALYEGDRTIIVSMTNVVGDVPADPQQVTATLVDDETAPTVSLTLAGSPMAENGGVANVFAVLSTPTNKTVTVALAFAGTASFDGHYTATASTIVIAAGNTQGNIQLTAIDDAVFVGDQTIVVSIDSVGNATENGDQQVTAVITDDEAPTTVSLSIDGGTLSENGGIVNVTATLGTAVSEDVTVNLAFGGTATQDVRYLPSSSNITLLAGETEVAMTLTGLDDSTYQGSQSIVVSIASVVGAAENGEQQVTATLTDDDSPPTVTIALANSTLAEDGGTATVTATLSAAAGVDVTVSLTFEGTAALNTDYTASPAIVISAGSTTADLALTAIDNATDDADKTIVVSIDEVVNGTIGVANEVTATIVDDDGATTIEAPTGLALASSSVLNGHPGFTASSTPTLSLSAATGTTVKVLVNGVTAVTASEGAAGQYTATIPDGFLKVGANSITAVASEGAVDSAASAALPLTYAPSFTQLYVVPGAVGVSQTISVVINSRLAAFSNEVGYIVADDATGAVDGLAPGSAGFAAAAMNKAVRLFDAAAVAGDDATITLAGGQYVVFYLVQNSTAAAFLATNPSNAVDGDVLVFFSADAANPDGVRHAATVGDITTGNLQYCWEDLTGDGDSDFNDLVLSFTPTGVVGQTGASLLAVANATETVAATVTLGAGETAGEGVVDADVVAGEVGIFFVDDSSGSVDGLAPDDDGYAAAALASANRQTLFATGSAFGAENTVNLTGGQRFAFYAINTGSAADMLANNPTNSSSGSAVAFFSFDAANANSLNHFRWYGGELVSRTAPAVNSTSDPLLLQVMTSIFGGEQDFSDFTLNVDLG